MQHNLDVEIASKYGVNAALFLGNMAFWIKHNQANRKHLHEGRYWTYNSLDAFAELFPYWSAKQIRTIIDNLISDGLIMKHNFNSAKYDRTTWYALTDLGHEALKIPICPNGQMDLTKRANGFDQTGRPIPDKKPDIKPNDKSFCSIEQKKVNEVKHNFAKSGFASVEGQTTTYDPNRSGSNTLHLRF